MPCVSIEELRLAAQRKYHTTYRTVSLRGHQPFVAKLVPRGALSSSNAPTLYVAQRNTRISVAEEPKQLDSCSAARLTRLLFYIIHVKRVAQNNIK